MKSSSKTLNLRDKLRDIPFIDSILYLSIFGLLSGIAISKYFKFPITEGLSYQWNDAGTTCNPKIQGIGQHCFSDFYLPLNISNLNSPWSNSNVPYPPLALAIFKPFSYFNSMFGGRASLYLYFALIVTCALASVILVRRNYNFSKQTSSILFAVFMFSVPSIGILDRGNNIFLIIPLLLYICLNVENPRKTKIIIAGILVVAIKPQFVLIGIFFLVKRDWRNLKLWVIGSGMIIAFSFLFYPKDIVENILHWGYHLLLFQQYTEFGEIYPINISYNNLIEVLIKWLNLNVNRNIVTILVMALLIAVVYKLNRISRLISNIELLILIIFIPILFVGTSFHYYFSVLLIPFTYLVSANVGTVGFGSSSSGKIFGTKLRMSAIKSLFVVSFVPWVLPTRLFWPSLTTATGNISITWHLSHFLVNITFLILVFAPLPDRKSI